MLCCRPANAARPVYFQHATFYKMLNEKQVIDQVERSFIRSAIASLPAKWKWAGVAVIVVVTWYLGKSV
jgi:hypothetical protein